MRISDWSSDVCSSDLLGAKVTCVEFLDQILPGFDGEVRKEANKIFKKQGVEFKLGTKVTGVAVKGKKATVTVEPAKGGEAETITADCVLVSIGRKPNTDGLALDKIGLKTNQRGQTARSEEHTSDLQSLMRTSYAVFCLQKKHTRQTSKP